MADFNFSYRLFSVKDIEQWLVHNVENGLSDKVISRSRALAFVRNPHAQQEDAALVVVYNEQGESVGYTGAYAEEWSRPIVEGRYFWGSTQWMDPQYRGKGVSGKMMRLPESETAHVPPGCEEIATSCMCCALHTFPGMSSGCIHPWRYTDNTSSRWLCNSRAHTSRRSASSGPDTAPVDTACLAASASSLSRAFSDWLSA